MKNATLRSPPGLSFNTRYHSLNTSNFTLYCTSNITLTISFILHSCLSRLDFPTMECGSYPSELELSSHCIICSKKEEGERGRGQSSHLLAKSSLFIRFLLKLHNFCICILSLPSSLTAREPGKCSSFIWALGHSNNTGYFLPPSPPSFLPSLLSSSLPSFQKKGGVPGWLSQISVQGLEKDIREQKGGLRCMFPSPFDLVTT